MIEFFIVKEHTKDEDILKLPFLLCTAVEFAGLHYDLQQHYARLDDSLLLGDFQVSLLTSFNGKSEQQEKGYLDKNTDKIIKRLISNKCSVDDVIEEPELIAGELEEEGFSDDDINEVVKIKADLEEGSTIKERAELYAQLRKTTEENREKKSRRSSLGFNWKPGEDTVKSTKPSSDENQATTSGFNPVREFKVTYTNSVFGIKSTAEPLIFNPPEQPTQPGDLFDESVSPIDNV